jgi:hypothetical protein
MTAGERMGGPVRPAWGALTRIQRGDDGQNLEAPAVVTEPPAAVDQLRQRIQPPPTLATVDDCGQVSKEEAHGEDPQLPVGDVNSLR